MCRNFANMKAQTEGNYSNMNDFAENYTDFDEKSLEFSFAQAEKMLADVSAFNDEVSRKTTWFAGIALTFLSAILFFFFKEAEVLQTNYVSSIYILITGIIISLMVIIFGNVSMKLYKFKGIKPSVIKYLPVLNQFRETSKIKDHSLIKELLASSIIHYDKKIGAGIKKNESIAKTFNISVAIFSMSIISSTLVAIFGGCVSSIPFALLDHRQTQLVVEFLGLVW
jgi:hypothetical protein